MPAGIPGNISRQPENATVETQLNDAANPVTAFGLPAVLDSTAFALRPFGSSDTAASIYGFIVRPFPTQGSATNASNTYGGGTPAASGIIDVLKRGYINVQLNGTTQATKNGTVYVRISANGANTIVGGVEAAADGSHTVALTNAYFTGPADATPTSGASPSNAEVAFNI
jgi:hypothetical protein